MESVKTSISTEKCGGLDRGVICIIFFEIIFEYKRIGDQVLSIKSNAYIRENEKRVIKCRGIIIKLVKNVL